MVNSKRKCVLLIKNGIFTLALRRLKAYYRIIDGSNDTPLNIIKLYRMEVLPSEVLDISGSLHLIIGYLLRDEYYELGI